MALAVDPDRAHAFGQSIVVGEDSPPVAVAAQGLGREKRSAADIGQSPCLASSVFSAQGLGRVLDDKQTVFLGYLLDPAVSAGQAEEVDRYDALGGQRPDVGCRLPVASGW